MSATLIIKDEQNGSQSKINLNLDRLRIGKKGSLNDLVLARASISRQHCVLEKREGQYYIKDMGSSNGTYLNGQRLADETILPNNAKIKLGEFEIIYQNPKAPEAAPPQKVTAKTNKADETGMLDNVGRLVPGESAAEAVAPVKKVKKVRGPSAPIPLVLKRTIHDKLRMNKQIRLMDFSKVDPKEAWATTKAVVDEIIQSIARDIPRNVNIKQLVKEILDEALKLGPLEELLEDDSVTEIMVNHAEQIFIEQNGHCVLSERKFTDNEQVLQIIRRILAPLGRRIDESSPLVDARLKDGSRVNAIIPPLAVSGPCITIRKFPKERLTINHLIGFGTLTPAMAQFLEIVVQAHKNTVISGGTGSGKTTLLNVISSFIPDTERVVTIEDVSELKLPQEHVVTLESRPANLEGKGAIGIQHLVINSLRMRPDRIVVGECRGGEALDMLQAMNTGHDGSLTTLHANSPRDAISRMETMVLMAGTDLPARAIREQIASAVDVIIQQTRLTDGTRRIMKISEVTGMEGNVVTMQDIFSFEQKGYDANGKVDGYHRATGSIPKFIQEMRKRGLAVDMSMFAT